MYWEGVRGRDPCELAVQVLFREIVYGVNWGRHNKWQHMSTTQDKDRSTIVIRSGESIDVKQQLQERAHTAKECIGGWREKTEPWLIKRPFVAPDSMEEKLGECVKVPEV